MGLDLDLICGVHKTLRFACAGPRAFPCIPVCVQFVILGCILGGFQHILCMGLESWLLVTVNFNLVARHQLDDSPHLRGLLCSCCLSGSLICPIFDLARGPVWCPRRQVVQYPKLGGGG